MFNVYSFAKKLCGESTHYGTWISDWKPFNGHPAFQLSTAILTLSCIAWSLSRQFSGHYNTWSPFIIFPRDGALNLPCKHPVPLSHSPNIIYKVCSEQIGGPSGQHTSFSIWTWARTNIHQHFSGLGKLLLHVLYPNRPPLVRQQRTILTRNRTFLHQILPF